MEMRSLTRREFIRWSGGLVLLGLGGSLLASCGKKDACSDLSALGPEERRTRVTHAYRPRTLIPARRCDNCHFWQGMKPGADCGGCQLVKGPISPHGYCNAWAEPQPGTGQEPPRAG